MTDRLGQKLGNYHLIRLLGRGAFAEVYLGEHQHLGTQAAVKVLRTQLTSNNVEKFRTEARTIARLEHPHIVRVLDFGVEDDTPFLVMDYAPHGTLRQSLPTGIPLSPERIVPYVKQAAAALQYAHDQKLIHRDIKPENMLLNRNNEVLLSDFGLVVIAQSSESLNTQEAAGTVSYMAPEQLQGKPRPASDQYALGVVAYEWLSGDRPFHGSFIELYSQHLQVPPPPLTEKVLGVSLAVEDVVLKALAKDPQERFARIEDFAQALEQASQYAPSRPGLPSEVITSPEQSPLSTNEVPPQGSLPGSTVLISSPELANVPSSTPTPQSSELQPINASQHQSSIRSLTMPRRTTLMTIIGLVLAVLVVTILLYNSSPIFRGGGPAARPAPAARSLPYSYGGHTAAIHGVAWSPDGKRIASASNDKTVQIWDVSTGKHLFTYTGHAGSVNSVAWSPDGKRIASGGDDKTVQVWDANTGSRVFTFTGHTDAVNSLAWSHDSTRLASASDDGTVQVWNVSTGSHLLTYTRHSSAVSNVTWSPGGKRIASASADKTVQVWDAGNGSLLFTYRGHTDAVNSVSWSPDGTRIASGSDDKTVQVWDANNGKHLFTYTGHTGVVNSVAWAPNSKRIASASDDGTVHVWNASTGERVFTFTRHTGGANRVAWASDGKRLVSTGSDDKTAWVWQV